ncbi:VOC family protein [Corynebacterium lubricantis]|uniref:VOC family protein n=1 Tax=Corynebacterium lubricantis TaxID=541095 RepID=UPI000368A4AD|nr:VOC family protein [Corynebacterium lubricantis]
MTAQFTSYRRFPGTAAQAMELYNSVFGGELQIMKFDQVHTAEEVGGAENLDLVMHAELRVNGEPILFASDSPDAQELILGNDTPVAITGGPEDLEQIQGWWDQLSADSEISMPFGQVPWGASFGMLQDKFGTHWFFNVGN